MTDAINHEGLQYIREADFLIDYLRFASRVNPLSAIANYREYYARKLSIDRRALFVAQQSLLIGSLEDLSTFLWALHEGGKGSSTVLDALAVKDEKKANFPNLLKKFKSVEDLLKWIHVDKQIIIDFALKRGTPKEEIDNNLEFRVSEILNGIEECRKLKSSRQKAYNKTKHGKPIISIRQNMMDGHDLADEKEGPRFFYFDKKRQILRDDTIPYSEDQFKKMTALIITLSEVIRDLLFLFFAQYHNTDWDKFEKAYDKHESFRVELPELF